MLAAGLGVAGYSLALAVGREPMATADKPDARLTMARPRAPARLTPHRDRRAFAVPATASMRGSIRTYRVIVRGLPADLPSDAGLAAFAPRTGIVFDWVPITDGIEHGGGALEFAIRAPAREARLSLSTGRRHAHHGYVASRIVRFDPQTPTVQFDITAAVTRFELEPELQRAGPLLLSRVDDAEWQPIAAAPNGLLFVDGAAQVLLGAGSYELVDPVDSSLRQPFSVPARAPIRIESRLARPRGRRP